MTEVLEHDPPVSGRPAISEHSHCVAELEEQYAGPPLEGAGLPVPPSASRPVVDELHAPKKQATTTTIARFIARRA